MISCSWLFREMQSNFSKFCLVFWRTIWLLRSHGCTGARDQHLHVGSARTGIVTKLNAVLTQFPVVFLWKEIFGVLGLQVNVSLAQGMGHKKIHSGFQNTSADVKFSEICSFQVFKKLFWWKNQMLLWLPNIFLHSDAAAHFQCLLLLVFGVRSDR